MKSPAFQFYAGDFLVGTMGMSDEEVGIYIRMLAVQWERGSLPGKPLEIKKLIGSKCKPSAAVLQKFDLGSDGFLRNSRLEIERKKQENYKTSRAENAKKRWGQQSKPDAYAPAVHMPMQCTADALQSSSPSSTSVISPKPLAWDSDVGGEQNPQPRPILPTQAQAIAHAPAVGIDPKAAEGWWLSVEARGVTPSGYFIDKDGREIRNWQASMTKYGKTWQNNEAERAKERAEKAAKPPAKVSL